MRYELRLSAYDMLEQVNYTLRIGAGAELDGDPWRWETIRAGHFPGEGEAERDAWVRDVLVAVLESL